MSAVMEKWEMHLSQQAEGEAKAEQKSAEGAVREGRVLVMNPRIGALREARDNAERRFQEAILDLETREQSPTFQKARNLYDNGLRVSLTQLDDGDKFVSLMVEDASIKGSHVRRFRYSDLDENGDQLSEFRFLGMAQEELNQELDYANATELTNLLRYLADITQENPVRDRHSLQTSSEKIIE